MSGFTYLKVTQCVLLHLIPLRFFFSPTHLLSLRSHFWRLPTHLPEQVGVKIDDEVIGSLNKRTKDSGAQIAFLERNLTQMCKQVSRLKLLLE
jgi:hypothetical protein